MNLQSRVTRLERHRFGRSLANLSDRERRDLEFQRRLESLSEAELDESIQAACAAMVAQLSADRQEIDRRRAEGTMSAEEFDAWLHESREYFDMIRRHDPVSAARLEMAAGLPEAAGQPG
jgi:arylsulfatase A-like enzyme